VVDFRSLYLLIVLLLGLVDVLVLDVLPLALEEKISQRCRLRRRVQFNEITYAAVPGIPELVGGGIEGTVPST
jgi:hypothetical protein